MYSCWIHIIYITNFAKNQQNNANLIEKNVCSWYNWHMIKRVGGYVMKEQISIEQISKFNEEYNKNREPN